MRVSTEIDVPKRRAIAWLTFIVVAIGCDGETGSARGARGLGSLATGCDVEATSRVTDSGEWIVPSEREVMEPLHNISTTDVSRAADGSLIVLDAGRTRVVQLDAQGAIIREWKSRSGQGPGEFAGRARAVALGADDRVYVSDSRGRVHVFSAQGEFERTIQTTGIVDARDMVVLHDGRIVLAADVSSHGMNKAYVVIVSSNGRLVREVLVLDRDHAVGTRPLLGPRNPVRLSMSRSGDFAVWYPFDNFVELFDSDGELVRRIEGCMPDELAAHYQELTRSGASGGSAVPLTLGVSVDANGGIDVLSRYTEGTNNVLRNLRYDASASAPVVRDVELAPSSPADGAERFEESVFALYHSGVPDNGIRKVRFVQQ